MFGFFCFSLFFLFFTFYKPEKSIMLNAQQDNGGHPTLGRGKLVFVDSKTTSCRAEEMKLKQMGFDFVNTFRLVNHVYKGC